MAFSIHFFLSHEIFTKSKQFLRSIFLQLDKNKQRNKKICIVTKQLYFDFQKSQRLLITTRMFG